MPKLRVEFCSYGSGRGRLGGQIDLPSGEPLGSVTLEVGASPTTRANFKPGQDGRQVATR